MLHPLPPAEEPRDPFGRHEGHAGLLTGEHAAAPAWKTRDWWLTGLGSVILLCILLTFLHTGSVFTTIITRDIAWVCVGLCVGVLLLLFTEMCASRGRS